MAKPVNMPDPKGFYGKYRVFHVGERGTLGEEVEGPVFTLRPYDPHARVALKAYADSVRETNPKLAADLEHLVAAHS